MQLCFPFPKVNKLPVLLEYGFQYDSSLNCKSKLGKQTYFYQNSSLPLPSVYETLKHRRKK